MSVPAPVAQAGEEGRRGRIDRARQGEAARHFRQNWSDVRSRRVIFAPPHTPHQHDTIDRIQ